MCFFQVAEDNYKALLSFFAKFPNFTQNEFFIFGESYGGIYAPTLSLRVLAGSAKIKFKVSGGDPWRSSDLPKATEDALCKYPTVPSFTRLQMSDLQGSTLDQTGLTSIYLGVIKVCFQLKRVFSGLCSGEWHQQLCAQ